jgi:hypothetical protein
MKIKMLMNLGVAWDEFMWHENCLHQKKYCSEPLVFVCNQLLRSSHLLDSPMGSKPKDCIWLIK